MVETITTEDTEKYKVLPELTCGPLRRNIMNIFHVVLPEKWAEAANGAFYAADSLAAEGFIHCCYAEQLDGVLKRYYGDASRVTILKIDTSKLMAMVVDEKAANGEVYPHVFGPINVDAVVGTEERTL